MIITGYPFCGEPDLPRVLALIQRMPLACRHALDFPWRLSSPAIQEGRDAAFWEDENGRVVGFAAWQIYWAALDFYILPGPTAKQVEAKLFSWAEARFRELDNERGRPLPYWVECRDDDYERLQLVKAQGFMLEDDDSYVLFQHALDKLAPIPMLAEGFTLRPLLGEQEVAAYAELHRLAFESASMNSAWRARSLRTPQYRAELDLVISGPDGSPVAFCVGWFNPERQVAQIEPIGVHHDFRRRGFARTLLLEILHRVKSLGAVSAFIEPFADNVPIHATCEAVDFRRIHTIRRLGKWLTQPV